MAGPGEGGGGAGWIGTLLGALGAGGGGLPTIGSAIQTYLTRLPPGVSVPALGGQPTPPPPPQVPDVPAPPTPPGASGGAPLGPYFVGPLPSQDPALAALAAAGSTRRTRKPPKRVTRVLTEIENKFGKAAAEALHKQVRMDRAMQQSMSRLGGRVGGRLAERAVGMLGRFGGPLGAIIGIAVPSQLGSGEAVPGALPQPWARRSEAPKVPAKASPVPGPTVAQLERIEVTAQRLPSIDPFERIEVTAQRLPTPARAPSTVQSQRTTPRAVQTIQRAMNDPLARALTQLLPMGQRSRARDPLTVPRTTLTSDPLTPLQPGALGSPYPQGAGFMPPSGGGSRQCECKADRKRKRRTCRERAQVEWRTGRKKGQLAGSRCVVWDSQ